MLIGFVAVFVSTVYRFSSVLRKLNENFILTPTVRERVQEEDASPPVHSAEANDTIQKLCQLKVFGIYTAKFLSRNISFCCINNFS